MSTPGSDKVTIRDAKDLLGILTLDRVEFYALHADVLERSSDDDPDDGPVPSEIRTAFRFSSTGAEYRVDLTVQGPGLKVRADAAIVFASTNPLIATREVLLDFGENVAVMALFPFIRQAVTDLAQRLGATVTIPLLPRGTITFAHSPDTATDEGPGD